MFTARDALFLAFCGILHLVYRHHRRRRLPLPPGLPRWPIIGNALSVPRQQPHIFYKELGERLGTKILYFDMMGQPTLIINDLDAAHELLSRRSALYSSRPRFRMLNEVADFNHVFAMMPYGEDWRVRRRIFQQHFSERNMDRLQERELDFVRKGLLPNIFSSPDNFNDHIRHLVGSLSTSMTYGLPVKRSEDPLVRYAVETFAMVTAALAPQAYLVNVISPLKYVPDWMPGAHFKTVGRNIRERLTYLMEVPYSEALKGMDEGTAQASFVSDRTEKCKDDQDFDAQARLTKDAAVQVFGAFFNTTVASIRTFILAMVQNPEIQRQVQKELDAVVGPDRLPEFSDIEHLVYLRAVLKETLRWSPVAPMAIPHQTSDEDVFEGYYIPKDCTVLANAYAMLHNDKTFSEPDKFNPGRFLKDGVLREDVLDPEKVAAFGFGRRACPGSHVALSTLRITAASIAHLFSISPVLDERGKPVQINAEFAAAVIANPLSFQCKFTPRLDRDVAFLLKDYMGYDII